MCVAGRGLLCLILSEKSSSTWPWWSLMSLLSENDSVHFTFHHLYHRDLFSSSSPLLLLKYTLHWRPWFYFFDIQKWNVPIHIDIKCTFLYCNCLSGWDDVIAQTSTSKLPTLVASDWLTRVALVWVCCYLGSATLDFSIGLECIVTYKCHWVSPRLENPALIRNKSLECCHFESLWAARTHTNTLMSICLLALFFIFWDVTYF